MSELMKQYRHLVKNIDSFSNGQAAVSENQADSDSLNTINVVIKPNDGLYKGGKFEFTIEMNEENPLQEPPKIQSLTKVYHPNIDQIDEYSEGDICLNLLDELWTTSLTLEDYVQGLLFMFYNPNVEDPLNPAFDGSESEEKLRYNVRMSLRGREVEGVDYDNVLEDGYESEDGETYDKDYDTKYPDRRKDVDDESDTDSSEENDNPPETTNDDTVPAKSEDIMTLSVIDEEEEIDGATGQLLAMPTNDEGIKPPTPSLVSTLSWILRFLRPSVSFPLRDNSNGSMISIMRPNLSTIIMCSVAFIAVRVGLRFITKLNGIR